MQFVLIGRTGSGKTSIARAFQEQLDIPYISSGDIVRQLAAEDEDTRRALDLGLFAPEEVVRDRVHTEMEHAMITKGNWIMEGFPRKVEQLVCILAWVNHEPLFIHLDCPEFYCIQRLAQRGRSDDNADSVAEKLSAFRKHTMPMLEILDDVGRLYRIDAEQDVADSVRELENLAV